MLAILGILLLASAVMLVITLAVLAFVWQYRAMKRRAEALQAWARQRGLQFTETDGALERTFRGFAPFGTGSGRRCKNIIAGRFNDRPVTVFQYQYTVQRDKSSQTYQFRVLAVRMGLDGQELMIKPEHFGHKLIDALGGEDIDFESDRFSRSFWVQCKDRRLAYDIITPRMQSWLLENGRRHWQWRGDTLLLYESGRLDVDHIDGLLALAFAFIGRLPRHRVAEASV